MRTLTEATVRQLIQDWYEALSQHAPVEELLPYLARHGLLMRFPETTVRSHSEFRNWYGDVTARYFDEVHDLRKLDVLLTSPLHADLSGVVRWQARARQSSMARSIWLGFDTYLSCSLVLQDGAIRIRTYGIDDMAPMPGSALL